MPKVKMELKRYFILYTRATIEVEANTVEEILELLKEEIKIKVG